MPDFLFDFQAVLVEWAIRRGKAAIFADCGLGKTPMQLVWAQNVVEKTSKPVLILTPIAVGAQTLREAEKFGIDAARSPDGTVRPGINITNYERLHFFNPQDFAGVVCDESSILKSFSGATRAAITEFMRTRRYRLLCTATAAPNDYIELGTSSEALGELGHMDMLERFFKKNENVPTTRRWAKGGEYDAQWRFKGHAENHFWRWVSSWSRAIRKPSDLGFKDDLFQLPALEEVEHTIKPRSPRTGMLFDLPAVGLNEQREERRRTIRERCEKVADLVDTADQALVWCHLNDEGDLLENLIPDAVQVAGKHSEEDKEAKLTAFAAGDERILVTKPTIGAWGLNLQRCAHVAFFPSHSYEQYYQGVRRCWRFGQDRPVLVDLVMTEAEERVMSNLRRKAEQADKMFTSLVEHMNNPEVHKKTYYAGDIAEEVPEWLS